MEQNHLETRGDSGQASDMTKPNVLHLEPAVFNGQNIRHGSSHEYDGEKNIKVGPILPVTCGRYCSQGPADLGSPIIPVGIVWVYESSDTCLKPAPIEILTRALSCLLDYCPQLTGRLTIDTLSGIRSIDRRGTGIRLASVMAGAGGCLQLFRHLAEIYRVVVVHDSIKEPILKHLPGSWSGDTVYIVRTRSLEIKCNESRRRLLGVDIYGAIGSHMAAIADGKITDANLVGLASMRLLHQH